VRTSSGPNPHIAYDARTGILSVTKGHMQVHGSVEEVSAFASTLIRAVRDHSKSEERLCPPDFLHELVTMGV